MPRVHSRDWRGVVRLRDPWPVPVQTDPGGLQGRKFTQQTLLRQQHRHVGVRQHEGQPVGRIIRIQRHVRAARLQNAQQPDHHLQRTLHTNPHEHIRTDPALDEVLRQLVGAAIEFAVRQARLTERHRHRLGRARHLHRDQLMQANLAWIIDGLVVPFLEQLPPLGGRQQRQLAQPLLRLRRRREQQRFKMSQPPANRDLREQVGAVLDEAFDALRPLDHLHRQVELGRAGVDLLRSARHSRQR